MEVLLFRYRVPSRVAPVLSNVPIPLPSYSSSSIRDLALNTAVADLIAKGAIEPAPLSPGYYRRLFVTPKVTGGWRPVIDLSCLRRSVLVSFSHGDSTDDSPVSPFRRLVGVSRSSGCLPPGSGASDISPLPEVLCGGSIVSISSALFRPFYCSADVHTCHGPNLVDNASFRLPDPEVPRRLASPWVLVPRDCTGEGFSPLAVSGARHSCQPGQELPVSFTDPGLSGGEASDTSFEGFPDPQTCPEALISRLRIRLLSSSTSCLFGISC